MRKFLCLFFGSVLPFSFSASASADIFSGTHPKLGTINLSMNSECRKEARCTDTEGVVIYRYGIRFKNIIAYGSGESPGEGFHARKGGAFISDTDNEGNVCRGTLSRSWWGSDLKIIITYDSGSACPVAGETYSVHLEKQPSNTGFAVGMTNNPIEKIWLADDTNGKRSNHYVLPGDLFTIEGEFQRSYAPVSVNHANGWLSFTQMLLNRKFAPWGV